MKCMKPKKSVEQEFKHLMYVQERPMQNGADKPFNGKRPNYTYLQLRP